VIYVDKSRCTIRGCYGATGLNEMHQAASRHPPSRWAGLSTRKTSMYSGFEFFAGGLERWRWIDGSLVEDDSKQGSL